MLSLRMLSRVLWRLPMRWRRSLRMPLRPRCLGINRLGCRMLRDPAGRLRRNIALCRWRLP
jgi:hypothetical protein